MKSLAFTITTTATRIITANASPQTAYLHIVGNGIVYLGGSDVTAANGTATEKHTVPFELFVPPNNEVWAIVATGTESLRILQEDGAS